MEKLIKAWGSHPPGTLVTTDLADVKSDGAVRVGVKRLDFLRAGGYLASGESGRRPLRGREARVQFLPPDGSALPPVDITEALAPNPLVPFVPALQGEIQGPPAELAGGAPADPVVFEEFPEKREE
jgi:hypothetical protein